MIAIPRNTMSGFRLKMACAVAFAGFGDWLIYQHSQFSGVLGFCGLALLLALLLARPAVRRDLRALLALTCAAISATAFLFDPGWLAAVLFCIFAGMATLLPGTAAFDDGWRWFQRLIFSSLDSLFKPFKDTRRLMRTRRRWRRGSFNLRSVFAVLALPLAGSTVIIALFAMANPVLAQWLDAIRLPGLEDFAVGRLLLWLVLLSCCWSLLRPRLPRRLSGTFDGRGDLAMAGVTPQSVQLSLLAFNALFALQNGMDIAWLWGILPLPDGITLAQYAHRGAYPLIATSLLAALFVLVALRPGSRTAAVTAIRWLVILWIGQNLLLVASSVLRTLDYIDAYSLTSLRIAALLWMGLVAIGLMLTCWRMLFNRSGAWLINANLLTAFSLLFAVSFVDLDAVAADWNVRHAREMDGTGANLDLCYLQSLGSSALLPLVYLEQHPAPENMQPVVRLLRENAHADLAHSLDHGYWNLLGKMRLNEAQQLLGPEGVSPKNRGPIACDQQSPDDRSVRN
jgi:Domain of unknown function (DUF4173)